MSQLLVLFYQREMSDSGYEHEGIRVVELWASVDVGLDGEVRRVNLGILRGEHVSGCMLNTEDMDLITALRASNNFCGQNCHCLYPTYVYVYHLLTHNSKCVLPKKHLRGVCVSGRIEGWPL